MNAVYKIMIIYLAALTMPLFAKISSNPFEKLRDDQLQREYEKCRLALDTVQLSGQNSQSIELRLKARETIDTFKLVVAEINRRISAENDVAQLQKLADLFFIS